MRRKGATAISAETPSPAGRARHALDTRAIWAIALPAMVTNVATALIGLGDMWIVGRLDDAATQGAVDVGARLFAMLFTVMNFLKTGTTGLVAQAGTRSGTAEQAAILLRGATIGLAIAAALLLAKPLLMPALLDALGARGDVLAAARIYADIRYWSAPGVMLNLALVGYLVGQRRMAAVLVIEVVYNLLNVALGLWFVLGLDTGIAGVGWSSFIAEYAKLAILAAFVARGSHGATLLAAAREKTVLRWASLRPFLSLNRDLFLRTVVLMIALAALTRLSAERGAVVLAANGILYQMFVFTALLLDGFENAAQVLNGERRGAEDRAGFAAYIRAIMVRGMGAAALVALAFALLADPVLASFAATPAVARAAQEQAIWLVLIPFAGVAGFVFDGVFVGASWTRALLLSMLGASAVYALTLWFAWPQGNWGLWLAFTLFLVARAAFQAAMLPFLLRRGFASGT
ncbi:MATE family efflux transporter [Pelagerythrobacter marensis]|uniref:MATE family efflux transporter n=1 Tax=Pelagerythrobacter marensis TaxID=543877 RepID=A0ABZ2D3S8_9SPHN